MLWVLIRSTEALLTSTHNICFHEEIRKILVMLTHFNMETPKREIGKLCRPRSDATVCDI